MLKKKGLGKRIAGIILAVSMVVTLIPHMNFLASGVEVNGKPIYNDIVFSAIEDKIKDSAYSSRNSVYGGIGPWFHWDEANRIGKTHVYQNSYFLSTLVTLRPSVSVISTDGNHWKAVFEASYKVDSLLKNNPDVYLDFGATFVSSKEKASMVLNGTRLGGSSLTQRTTQTITGTTKYPFADDLNITVSGAAGTTIENMWVAAMDNTTAKYKDITVDLETSGLYFYIQMDEELRWANNQADEHIDDMYLEFYLTDSLTNVESKKLKANFHKLENDTITFRCDTRTLGDFMEKEFQVTRISRVCMPVITGIDFAVYGVRGCYDYQYTIDPVTRQPIYEKVDNAITYMQDVTLDTTPITDLAGNRVDLTSISLIGKDIRFDQVAPEIEEVVLTDATGANREAASDSDVVGKDESNWPADVNRKELFLGQNQGVNVSVIISEPVEVFDVKAKLNVLDENGEQIELALSSISAKEATIYGERTRTELKFETFIAKSGMSMMTEGEAIKVVEISGVIKDKADNRLSSVMYAPSMQLFMDVTAPEIVVKKIPTDDNSRKLKFSVSVNDKVSEELAAGLLGETATMMLTANALTELNYTYKVLDVNGQELSAGIGIMGRTKGDTIRWKLHDHNSYAVTVEIEFTNSNKITVDEIFAQVSVTDILKNENRNNESEHPFVIDEVAPSIIIKPVKYTSDATTVSVKVPVVVTDYSEVASLQYQWTDRDVNVPDENAWQAADFTAGKEIQIEVALDNLSTNAQKKLWVKAGDNKGNFTEPAVTEVIVEINRPKIYFDTSNLGTEPDPAPVLTVIGPEAADATGCVRVTVTMGENTYVTLVETGKEINVFNFEGTWYQVSFNADNTGYATVEQLQDTTALKNYYGEVYVSFEAAYADLTPNAGVAFSAGVTNGSYVKDTTVVQVLYAPVSANPSDAYEVTFGEVTDATGENVLANDGASGNAPIAFTQIADEASVMAGIQFDFSINNLIRGIWTLRDIDFAKSYVELRYTKGTQTTVIDTQFLEIAVDQTYALPADFDYATGMYSIAVYVCQKGSDTAAKYESLNIVLDATKVENAGMWKYTVSPHYSWPSHDIEYKGVTAPLTSVGLTLSGVKEVERNNVFAYYTAGASHVSIELSCDQILEQYEGIPVGEVVGFRFWNSLSEISQEAFAEDNFVKTSDENGKAKAYFYLGIEQLDEADIVSKGFIVDGYDLPVVSGLNTFYYQVKLANGTISEIKQFNIAVSDMTPQLDIVVDGYETSIKPSENPGQIIVSSLNLKVKEAFSMNGTGKVTVMLYRQEDAVEVAIDELITLDRDEDNTYSAKYEPREYTANDTNVAFVVYDEFGGAMAVCPQIGSVPRLGQTGNDAHYNVNYIQYHIDGIMNNNIEYHIPVYAADGETILYYETKNTATGEVYRTTYENLAYNKYVIDTTEWTIAPYNSSGKDDCGSYVEKYFMVNSGDTYEKILPELVDYDSITLVYTYEENGETKQFTAPLVENYAEANPMGYMGGYHYGSYGQFGIYLAKPVDNARAENGESTTLSFQIKYIDVFGKEYTKDVVCDIAYTSNKIVGDMLTETGVEIHTDAATLGGIMAQNYRYYGIVPTGEFVKGKTCTGTYTDMFGTVHEFTHVLEDGWSFDVDVKYSNTKPTFENVTVQLNSTEGLNITVEEAPGITIVGNGSSIVEVTVNKNMDISFSMGNENVVEGTVSVDNIIDFVPTIQWSYDEADVLTDENGKTYLKGSLTAYIIDKDEDGLGLVGVFDAYTQKIPSYTFYPGEATSYTFKGEDYYALLGEEKVRGMDMVIKLPVDELRNESFEVPSEDIPTEDSKAPAVQLRAWAERNGIYQSENIALQIEPDDYRNALTDYVEDSILECFEKHADTTAFIEQIGWASTYRFQIELADENDVKLFIKKGLSADAPSYAFGSSDTISGVTLNGRILEIRENTEFTLFAVDEDGNTTTIPFAISNIGKSPIPRTKILYAGMQAYVYVFPAEGDAYDITNFKITNPSSAKEETDADSEYLGKLYVTFKKNGTYTINYSYTYRGEEIIGVVEVVVDEVDDLQIIKPVIQWSANKSKEATNQDVTAQLTFNKTVKEVYVPYGFEDKVSILITGNRVAVRYEENLSETLSLTAVAYNDTSTTVDLDAVTNIDKQAPVATTPDIVLAEDGKSVEVSFLVDEEALLRETNNYGTKSENGYVHSKIVKENGTYTYRFTDKAGNISEISFEVNVIVDTPLKLWFNTSATDTGAEENAEDFELQVGDSIYVKANRASEISLNRGQVQAVAANTWIALEITSNEAGLWPIIYAIDTYGNTATALLNGIAPLDTEAPVITIKKNQVVTKVGMSQEAVLALLRDNITVDDADQNVTVDILFTDDLNFEGVTTVTYTATDTSKNVTTKTGWLKLTSASEPEVAIDGQKVDRDCIYLADSEDALELTVDTAGEPYSVVYKQGVFTSAQMKTGATTLVRDAEDASAIALPLDAEGYYTIYIRTQSRDEYMIYVYVE